MSPLWSSVFRSFTHVCIRRPTGEPAETPTETSPGLASPSFVVGEDENDADERDSGQSTVKYGALDEEDNVWSR